jgi:hypothetical protein
MRSQPSSNGPASVSSLDLSCSDRFAGSAPATPRHHAPMDGVKSRSIPGWWKVVSLTNSAFHSEKSARGLPVMRVILKHPLYWNFVAKSSHWPDMESYTFVQKNQPIAAWTFLSILLPTRSGVKSEASHHGAAKLQREACLSMDLAMLLAGSLCM